MRRHPAIAALLAGVLAALSLPAAARPHLGCPPGKPPDWAQRSSHDAWVTNGGPFGDWYPAADGLSPGVVTLSCVAGGADGKLYDCEVVDEQPVNDGLGLWALHVALDLRLKRPGCPADGARFTFPLHFERAE